MVWYADLRNPALFSPAESDWTSRRLLELRAQLSSPPPGGIPRRTKDASLIIGTWNLRDFDNNKFRHGPRRRESLHYIAEILSSFDVCALQEVNEDLSALRQVLRLMGPGWDFFATDVTTGAGGNRERMCFVFDTRKVSFRNIVGEIVLPRHALLPGEQQFARTPFLVSFQAGWFRFSLCTVHIYFGDAARGSEGYARRVAEIDHIAREMAVRADEENENYILLGDFNIRNPVDETMTALTRAGFQLPPEQHPSNLLGTHYYDQIAFRTRPDELTFLSSGAFDWTQSLFRPEHYEHYAPVLPRRHRDFRPDGRLRDIGQDRDYYSRKWLTWQISDHLPLWVELAIDFSDAHLLNNLNPEIAVADIPAQPEVPDEEVAEGATTPEAGQAAPARARRRKRSFPRMARPERTGRLVVPQRLTLAEAWKILRWVAGGGGDRLRRQRNAARKPKRPPRKGKKKN